jgi:hypothetical protein
MPYSSSLSDKEWEIIEPLLPKKKQTRPPKWTKRQIQGWSVLSVEEWLQLGRLAHRLATVQGRCFGTIKTGVVKAYSMKL